MNKKTSKYLQKLLFGCITVILLLSALFIEKEIPQQDNPCIAQMSIGDEDPCDLIDFSK